MADTSSVPLAPVTCPPLRVEGPFVISTMTDWHGRVLNRVASDPVVIDLGGATEIDLFGLQLLLSARRSATEHGRAFALVGQPPVFTTACTSAGLAASLFSAP